MLELLKKTIVATLGTVLLTKDMVEDATRRLVEQGKITAEEADKLTRELVAQGEAKYQEIQVKVKDSVSRGLVSLDLCSKQSHDELKEQVANLRKRLELLESRIERMEGEKGAE